MSTEPRPPVSHRKLGLFGLAALIGAGGLAPRWRPDSAEMMRTRSGMPFAAKPAVSHAVAFVQLWPKEHGGSEKPGRGAG